MVPTAEEAVCGGFDNTKVSSVRVEEPFERCPFDDRTHQSGAKWTGRARNIELELDRVIEQKHLEEHARKK